MERPGAGGQGRLPGEGALIRDLKPSWGREGEPREEGRVSSFLETLLSALTGTSLRMGLLPALPPPSLPRPPARSPLEPPDRTVCHPLSRPRHTALSPPGTCSPATAEIKRTWDFS